MTAQPDLTMMDPEQLLAEASKEQPIQPRHYFGQLYQCEPSLQLFARGAPTGRVPFDPTQHRREDARLFLDVRFEPVSRPDRQSFTVSRVFAVQTREGKLARDSLATLGLDFRQAADGWFEIEMVPTRTYTNSMGETKQATAIKFVRHFPDEVACRAAYAERWGEPTDPVPAEPAADTPADPTEDPQLTVLGTMLSALWKASNADELVFAGMLAANSWLSSQIAPDAALALVKARG